MKKAPKKTSSVEVEGLKKKLTQALTDYDKATKRNRELVKLITM